MLEKNEQKKEHGFIMTNRAEISLTGVEDIESFDDKLAVIYTVMGKLTVKGTGIHIGSLNINDGSGSVTLSGYFNTFEYSNASNKRNESFVSRLFK